MKLVMWLLSFFKRKKKKRTTESIKKGTTESDRFDEYYCDEYYLRRYDDWHMDEDVWKDKYRC